MIVLPCGQPVLDAAAVLLGGQQAELLKLLHKAPDGGIGSVAEILFQTLGGEFLVTIGRQHKLPEVPLLLGDLTPAQRLIEGPQGLGLRLAFSQALVDRLRKVDKKRRYI